MNKTLIFIVSAIVVILGFDLYLYYTGGTENTISWFTYDLSYDKPFVTFLVGFVCGHLFWQMKKPPSLPKNNT